MSRLVLYMAMSLDGFIAGPDDSDGAAIERLHRWLGAGGPEVADFRPSDGQSQIVFDELMATGAVITGRRTGELVDYWGGDHHDGVPIFVPTHSAPAEPRHERVHFVTGGIVACVQQAKAAAGERDVMLLGAFTARECLKAGVLDEMEIQLMPVLLGEGRLLFEELSTGHIELDLLRTLEAPGVLHLRYRVRRCEVSKPGPGPAVTALRER